MQAHWTRKILIFPPIILGGAVLAYLILSKEPPEHRPPQEQAHHVRVIKAAALPVVPRALGFGSVEPGRVWNAVAQVAGRIEYLHPDFHKGAVMTADTVLVRIAPDDYKLAISQALANIRAAEAKLEELKINERNTRGSIKIEQDALAISQGEFARIEKLAKKGTVAQAVLDKERRNLLTQQKRVQDLQNLLRLLPTQIKAQREQIAVFQTQKETAELNLQRTSIRLPFNARIASRKVEITQFVGVGQQLGAADGMKTAQINAQVPQSRFRALIAAIIGTSPGGRITRDTLQQFEKKYGLHARVRLRFDDRDAMWRGRLSRISDTVDPKTRTIGVIVEVDDAYRKAIAGQRPPLIKGMFVEVEIRANPGKGEIVLPRSALHGGRVYVINDKGRLDVRSVEVGLSQGDIVTIAKGVAAGETVVVSDLSPAINKMLLVATRDVELETWLQGRAAGKEALK